MSEQNSNRVPHAETPGVALALIDVINDFDFPEAESLLEFALPMARSLATLCERARAANVPIIYLNDNFGRWKSDFRAQVEHCLHADRPGREIVQRLQPAESDYFILKPRHSGFFATSLEILLRHLRVETLVLTGVATNICVLFTANDAHMREFRVVVPPDCAAANSREDHAGALRIMQAACKADLTPSTEIDFALLARANQIPRGAATSG